MVNLTYNAITFVSSVKIILLSPKLLAPTASCLQPFFSIIKSVSASTSKCFAKTRSKKTRLSCFGTSSRLFSEKIWGSSSYLLTLFGIESGEIPSTSMRKFRIGLPMSSIYNLFSLNLMVMRLQKSPLLFAYSEKDSSLQLKHR